LDPRADQLPTGFLPPNQTANRDAVSRAYVLFCREVIDVVAALVPAVKPQAAFFEQLGPPGMTALGEVIGHARQRGLLVIVDGKRNDIGSTAEAYADGFLGAGQSAWGADALTVSPYLGADSLTPFVDIAEGRGAGLFVLVKTSNPGGGLLQDLVTDDMPLYERVARHVEAISAQKLGRCGFGSIGAVVGATYPQQLGELRATMPHAWFLVPGYGSQGATAADVTEAFDENGLGALINNSRGIIFAHRRPEYRDQVGQSNWQAAVDAATRDMIQQLREQTPAGNLDME
jgi:orotidine-5'-phosphate decarboxylase